MEPKMSSKSMKMDPWAPLGRLFDPLGRFWRVSKIHGFFDRPRVGQKTRKMESRVAKGAPRGLRRFAGATASAAGASGRPRAVQFL